MAGGARPVVVGKPHAPIFEMALERLGCRPDEAMMVGDGLTTDIAGGRAAGMATVWLDPDGGTRRPGRRTWSCPTSPGCWSPGRALATEQAPPPGSPPRRPGRLLRSAHERGDVAEGRARSGWPSRRPAGLAVAKLGVGLATNSIGLLSAAADSLFDAAMSSFNLWSIRIADSPADEGHPFGHGKAENLAGLVQVVFIGLVGGGSWSRRSGG